jgi:hypothetical protein
MRDLYRLLSMFNWIKALGRGPRALGRRAGRVAIGRGAGRLSRTLFPPRRRGR